MEIIIFILVAFLVIVYVYSFIRIRRKKRTGYKSDVLEFKNKYLKTKLSDENKQPIDSNYNKYITKYNSSVDYVSKDEFL